MSADRELAKRALEMLSTALGHRNLDADEIQLLISTAEAQAMNLELEHLREFMPIKEEVVDQAIFGSFDK